MQCRSMVPIDESLYQYLWVNGRYDYNSSLGFSMAGFRILEITYSRIITMYFPENRFKLDSSKVNGLMVKIMKDFQIGVGRIL